MSELMTCAFSPFNSVRDWLQNGLPFSLEWKERIIDHLAAGSKSPVERLWITSSHCGNMILVEPHGTQSEESFRLSFCECLTHTRNITEHGSYSFHIYLKSYFKFSVYCNFMCQRIKPILYIIIYNKLTRYRNEIYFYTNWPSNATFRGHLYFLAQPPRNGTHRIVGYQRQRRIHLCCLQKSIRWRYLMRQEVKLTLDSNVPWCLPTLECYLRRRHFSVSGCSRWI